MNKSCGIVITLFLLFISGCGKERLRAQYWETDPPSQPFSGLHHFPERDDDDLRIERVQGDEDIGVCFSGGGTRSASASLGQLRGLQTIGLMPRIKYISAVSGGSWAATPYTYLPDSIDDYTFLGGYVAPADLETKHFTPTYAPRGSLARAISETEVTAAFLYELFIKGHGDKSYSYVVARRLLQPFELHDKNKFFTYDQASRDSILERNPKLKADDFYLQRPGRPYLIVGGTIRRYDFWPWNWRKFENKRMPFEMTPLYVGVRRHFPNGGEWGRSIGGMYIEPFAYDSFAPKLMNDKEAEVSLQRDWGTFASARFTLGDMIGCSGAAPGEILIGQSLGQMPRFRHWNTTDISRGYSDHAYAHGDGGLSENLGLMSLLARRVKNIIVFINSDERVQEITPTKTDVIPRYAAAYFGEGGSDSFLSGDYSKNKVFDRADYQNLKTAIYQKVLNKEALTFAGTYTIDSSSVDPDDLYGLAIGKDEKYTVKIYWVFLSSDAWKKQIPPEVDAIVSKDGLYPDEFRNFPYLNTFLEGRGNGLNRYIIDLTVRQVTAMAHLTSWTIVEKKSEIETFFVSGPSTQN
jgi:hypothetical protein